MRSDHAAGGSALLVLDELPLPLTHGDRLRSYYLARALAATRPCVLAAPTSRLECLPTLQHDGPFADILILPERPARGHPRRLVRTSNERYLAAGWPSWLAECHRRLSEFIASHDVRMAVAGKLPVAELVSPLDVPYRLLDDFDCYTLTLEREYALHRAEMSWGARLSHRLSLARYRRQESRLSRHFEMVTTISPADGVRLQTLDPEARIEVVPNGVEPALLEQLSPAEGRGVAFWGNLAFEPNRSAVRWFMERVYAPHLAQHAIPCLLIGGGADRWISALPEQFPEVRVTGFVEDLAALVRTVPIMVNPMVSGSGLKNKMLEAMALGRAVVSSAMGAEAIAAVAETHYRQADTPSHFADAILELHRHPARAHALGRQAHELVSAQYTWPRVEARWREAFASLGAPT